VPTNSSEPAVEEIFIICPLVFNNGISLSVKSIRPIKLTSRVSLSFLETTLASFLSTKVPALLIKISIFSPKSKISLAHLCILSSSNKSSSKTLRFSFSVLFICTFSNCS